MKLRRIPSQFDEFEAIQYTGDNKQEILDFVFPTFVPIEEDKYEFFGDPEQGFTIQKPGEKKFIHLNRFGWIRKHHNGIFIHDWQAEYPNVSYEEIK